MRECRRVFSRRSLLWLLVLMAAVVFFHRVDHHNAPGFAAAYRQTAAQLAASPDPSAALSQMEAESRRYMTALLWRSTDDPDLLELYRDQARQVLGDDYETAAMAYDLSDQAQMEFTARQQAQQTLRQQLDYLAFVSRISGYHPRKRRQYAHPVHFHGQQRRKIPCGKREKNGPGLSPQR